jgi:hypothetical protein
LGKVRKTKPEQKMKSFEDSRNYLGRKTDETNQKNKR